MSVFGYYSVSPHSVFRNLNLDFCFPLKNPKTYVLWAHVMAEQSFGANQC